MSSKRMNQLIRLAIVLAVFMIAVSVSILEAQFREGHGGRGGMRDRSGTMKQTKKQNQEMAEKQFNDMCETLVLDKEHKKEARKAFDEMQKEKENLILEMQNGNLGKPQLKEKFRKVWKAYLDQIEALLNEEQKERFQLMREELEKQAEPVSSGRPDRRGGP
jgi:hypothetical protein